MLQETQYYLMHENIPIAKVSIDIDRNSIQVEYGYLDTNLDRLPIYTRCGTSQINKALEKWINNRMLPCTRYNVSEDLKTLDVSPLQYMLGNLAVSLSDHYWLKPISDRTLKWQGVSPYNKQFRYSAELSLDGYEFTPNSTVQGNLVKKWVILNGDTFLIKGDTPGKHSQSFREAFATMLNYRQGKGPYTAYDQVRVIYNNKDINASICRNFTNESIELIPASSVIGYSKKRNEESYYEAYIRNCREHGLSEEVIRGFMEYQILVDFVLSNTDRHLNNFGVLRDSRTLEFLRPAPIFDFGNSMFCDRYVPSGKSLLDISVTSFTKKEVNLLKYVKDPMRLDVGLLPTERDVVGWFVQDTSDTEEYVRMLARAYSQKVRYLRELQKGIKIYSYHYKQK